MPAIPSHLRALRLPACSLLALALGGCLTAPGPVVSGDGRCTDADLQWAVGKAGDEATMRKLAKDSGAGLVNPITPTTIVSRDIRQDRLRVYLDAGNVITAVRCE
ncbi:MAG: hypothetical protein ACN6O2_09490 [Stenotrophomonas sp.]|uniref:hypothetical protein n=1 Tax=Stenotrophomonas sp. TaxID=69392 RepID=UPI0028A9A267|nr:hypothetical protein [Stenotrophomonas sp.]